MRPAPSDSTWALVGPGFFELLGTAPVVGRTLEDADFDQTPRVVVIGHRLWQQRFGADRGVIGKTVRLNETNVEIVGVMAPEFKLPRADVQLWRTALFRTAGFQMSRAATPTGSSFSDGWRLGPHFIGACRDGRDRRAAPRAVSGHQCELRRSSPTR